MVARDTTNRSFEKEGFLWQRKNSIWCRPTPPRATSRRHRTAGRGGRAGRPLPDPVGRHRQRQDLHDGERHRPVQPPDAGAGPQQDAGRPALHRVPLVFPGQRRGIFRLLLRLLPAGGYIPSTDTYIEKDSAINDEIDRLRHSATAALSERRDVIIVASVSCIYSLGDPIDYRSMVISLRPGMQMERDELCEKLVTLQYERNDVNFIRNKFRVHGDIVDIYLPI